MLGLVSDKSALYAFRATPKRLGFNEHSPHRQNFGKYNWLSTLLEGKNGGGLHLHWLVGRGSQGWLVAGQRLDEKLGTLVTRERYVDRLLKWT